MKVISAIGAFLLVATPVSAADQIAPLNILNAGDQSSLTPPPGIPHCAGGTQQALRHQIEAIEAGNPDYDAMEARTADQLRNRIARIQPSLTTQWGRLISVKSLRHMPTAGTYEAQFERARVQWQITCQSERGKITGIAFKTLS